MTLEDKSVIVTGGANGIGRALCRRFAAEGARAVVVADRDGEGASQVASEIGGLAATVDVSNEKDIQNLVQHSLDRYGCVDLFCSNAGIFIPGGAEAPDEEWDRIWNVNVKSHIYAARAVVPRMIERGEGYLLNTASAAGLLSQIDSAPYSVTKHAAVSLAEWLAIHYGDRGIRVSCLCPQGVLTNMLREDDGTEVARFLHKTAISAEDCAESVVNGLAEERFLILPHPEVEEYFRRKSSDYDRWLGGMQRLKCKMHGEEQ